MVLEALSHIGFNKKSIRQGLKKIDNPGRFTWISPTILVDTANNRENIKIFSHMVRKLKKHTKIITLFGTTQVEPDYAGELAGMVQADKRILIDDFCDRSLPYESYKNFTQWTDAIHFSHEKEKIENWLSEKDTTIVVYGSFYLV